MLEVTIPTTYISINFQRMMKFFWFPICYTFEINLCCYKRKRKTLKMLSMLRCKFFSSNFFLLFSTLKQEQMASNNQNNREKLFEKEIEVQSLQTFYSYIFETIKIQEYIIRLIKSSCSYNRRLAVVVAF